MHQSWHMAMRWLEVVGALVVAIGCLSACTGRDADEPRGAAREIPGATTTTVGRGTATTTSSGGPAGPVALPAVAGEALSFEVTATFDQLGDRGTLLRSYPSGTKVTVSIRRVADTAGRETSGHFGVAEVRAIDADRVRFAVSGLVPSTMWVREQRAAVATEVATPAGDYEVGLPGLFAQRVAVRAMPVPPTSTTAPERGAPADRVLGERDLAGVLFGTPENEAIAALTARFGRPSFDDRDNTVCGEQRSVGWGSLITTYRTDPRRPGEPGRVLTGYTYHAARAALTDGPVGLRTASGLPPGAPVAVLRAVEPSVIFRTDQLGYAVTTWFATAGSRLAGRLSDDISAPDSSVTEISSSIAGQEPATYPGCELVLRGR
jgi:hypothetical protein